MQEEIGQKSSDRDQGTAYHEAAHAVVAWSLGLTVGHIAIGVGGDETAGKTEIDDNQNHLSQTDRLAICLAGLEAQHLFERPAAYNTGLLDFAKVLKIIGEDVTNEQSYGLRQAGYQRANELILMHEKKFLRLAMRLIERGEVKPQEFVDLMTEVEDDQRKVT